MLLGGFKSFVFQVNYLQAVDLYEMLSLISHKQPRAISQNLLFAALVIGTLMRRF